MTKVLCSVSAKDIKLIPDQTTFTSFARNKSIAVLLGMTKNLCHASLPVEDISWKLERQSYLSSVRTLARKALVIFDHDYEISIEIML